MRPPPREEGRIIIRTIFIYSAVSMTTGHCKSSLGSFDELQNSAQAAVDPQTKPPDLGCESACRQLSSTTTIANYYAALLPRMGPHIASHSVCPSVCLSVRPVIISERHVAPPSELK